jgi:ABC-2 type transport system ATP-binding protein
MIYARNLTKTYGDLCAVDRINLDIGMGEIFGFIGPNGAGKTTTIRMLSTLVEPDDGTAWIGGYCIRTEPTQVRRVLGYMPDYFGVYEGVTVWEYLDFFARAYRIPHKTRKKVIEDCVALTDFGKLTDKLVSSLSKGMQQRLCLAKTLLHDPKVLILDEPASGLDPRARVELRILLKELARMGKTILISSHILTELSDMVTSIGIIEKGKIIATGSPEKISQAISKSLPITIAIYGGQRIEEASKLLQSQPGVAQVTIQNKSLEIEYSGEEKEIYTLLKKLVNEDIPVVSVVCRERNLEEIFMQLTQGEVA